MFLYLNCFYMHLSTEYIITELSLQHVRDSECCFSSVVTVFEYTVSSFMVYMKTCMQSCNGLLVFIKHFVMYPLQDGCTPLHLAARGGHTACVEHLLSTPGIDGNIKNVVSLLT